MPEICGEHHPDHDQVSCEKVQPCYRRHVSHTHQIDWPGRVRPEKSSRKAEAAKIAATIEPARKTGDPEPEVPASAEDEEQTIQHRFEVFHDLNPRVYQILVRLAREAKDRGHDTLGIRTLWEVMRWEIMMTPHDPSQGEFKLNDHYHSRYARLMMEQEADLADFFEVRRLRA